ncbi:tissue factor-like [Toxotes jaculatrix]|uniref:tissue factor-like n=1 Tax=Toxotes jaculatrix TaxID=941984 RepID=UPI001B3B0BA4|nr:tissue factor-like [Toxotes jaculatrix]
MESVKTLFYMGICLSAWIITAADNLEPQVENVRWVSLDFKTVLTWTSKASDYAYTVLYSSDNNDWTESPDCIQVSESECDLSEQLIPYDRTYTADIRLDDDVRDYEGDPDVFPHTLSPPFNPFKQTNISAAEFTVEAVETKVTVNITDPLTGIHQRGKQLSIRDVFKNDLKYKISYHKSGSTGKRDIITDSSLAEVSGLDAGESYCFMVAAYIPSRARAAQLGAWSEQQCTDGHKNVLQELSLGAWVGAVFILLTVLIIIITVTVLCCRCCQQRNKSLQTSQSSAPV